MKKAYVETYAQCNRFAALGVQKSSLLNFSDEAKALFERMTTQPTASQKSNINTLITTLKGDGIWDKLDCFYVTAAHDDQAAKLNWIKDSHNLISTFGSGGSVPLFSAFKGFTGNQTNKAYLDTNYSPSTQAIKYLLNSASIGVYSRKLAQVLGNVTMGIEASKLSVGGRYNADQLVDRGTHFYGGLNNTGLFSPSSPPQVYNGIAAVVRENSSEVKRYRGEVAETVASVSTSIPAGNIDILTCGSFYDEPEVSMAWIGGALSSTEIENIVNYFEDYRNSIGDYSISILGDSNSGEHGSSSAISELMTFDTYGITDLAKSGYTIANQKSDWQNIFPASYKSRTNVTFNMIGLNDVVSIPSATVIAAYQDLVDTIRADVGSGNKIILATMIPCSYKVYQAYLDLNEAIRGNGATPITGADGFLDTTLTALNDGSGGLAAAYDEGDGLHINDAGRQIVADLYDAKITELGY